MNRSGIFKLSLFLILLLPFCLFPQSAEEYYYMGDEAHKNKDIKSARVYYEKAFEKDKGNLKYSIQLTRYYYNYFFDEIGIAKKLINSLDKNLSILLKRNPSIEVYYEIGYYLYIYGSLLPVGPNPTSIEDIILYVGKIRPKNADIFRNKGVQFLNKALTLCPPDSTDKLCRMYKLLAENYVATDKNYVKAIDYFKKSIQYDNKTSALYTAHTYFELAKCQYELKKLNEAKQTIDIAYSLGDDKQDEKFEEYKYYIYRDLELERIKNKNPEWEILTFYNFTPLIVDDLVYLYHPKSIVKTGKGIFRIWIKEVVIPIDNSRSDIVKNKFKGTEKYENYDASASAYIFNFNLNTAELTDEIDYDNNNKILGVYNEKTNPFSIPPNSLIEHIFLYMKNKLEQ